MPSILMLYLSKRYQANLYEVRIVALQAKTTSSNRTAKSSQALSDLIDVLVLVATVRRSRDIQLR